MTEVINRKHGRRRHPDAKRGIQPYILVNVVLAVGLVIAVYAMTR
ncbi:hypothetical protein ACLH0K_13400 [Arthrobacter sp. MPF02]